MRHDGRQDDAITHWQSTAGPPRAPPAPPSTRPGDEASVPFGLSTTLSAELATLRHTGRCDEVLEVMASCLRHREPAMALLQLRGRLWPLTVFPREGRYHVPRSLLRALAKGGDDNDLAVVAVEPPGLEADNPTLELHPLAPLLWALALHAPGPTLLAALRTGSAYRLTAPAGAQLEAPPDAAMAAALQRLHVGTVSLATIADWPGMDTERAVRLLNGAYLQGGLMVLSRPPILRAGALGRWWPGARTTTPAFDTSSA